MSKVISLLCVIYCFPAQAMEATHECRLVSWWAAKALYIAQELQLPAEKWHIAPEGFTKEGHELILAIKREAYTDPKALARRVGLACAPRIPT